MDAKKFYDTVRDMRKAQIKYFSTRDNIVLQEAKRLEAIIDNEIKRVDEITQNKKYPKIF